MGKWNVELKVNKNIASSVLLLLNCRSIHTLHLLTKSITIGTTRVQWQSVLSVRVKKAVYEILKMTTSNAEILARAGMVLTRPNGSDSSGTAACLPSSSASFPCEKWGKLFAEKKRKTQHEKDCGGIDCHHCTKHFSSRRALKEHINTTHNTNFRCVVCKKCFGGLSKLNRHMPTHEESRRVTCKICGKIFNRKDNLTRHMKKHQ